MLALLLAAVGVCVTSLAAGFAVRSRLARRGVGAAGAG